MNTAIQSQLSRVESALTTLIDSIAAYNPSVPAATTLLTADDELRKGLKHLAQHQANHARILGLRDNIAQQHDRITSTVKALADLRTDLLSTPASLTLKDTRNVPYTELLGYAKRISRYTGPSTFQPPLPPMPPQSVADPTLAINGDTEAPKKGEEDGNGIGTDALGPDERQWLEPLKHMPFVPWVDDDTIRRSALAQIQALVERGEDPTIVKPEGMEEEGKKAANLGMVGVVREQMAESGGRDVRREQESKPAVFSGLDLYDPDEDED